MASSETSVVPPPMTTNRHLPSRGLRTRRASSRILFQPPADFRAKLCPRPFTWYRLLCFPHASLFPPPCSIHLIPWYQLVSIGPPGFKPGCSVMFKLPRRSSIIPLMKACYPFLKEAFSQLYPEPYFRQWLIEAPKTGRGMIYFLWPFRTSTSVTTETSPAPQITASPTPTSALKLPCL